MKKDREDRLIRKALSKDVFRRDAVSVLGSAKSKRASATLRRVLQRDSDKWCRMYAISGLIRMRDSDAASLLIVTLGKDREEDVRWSAAEALGKLKCAEAGPALMKGLADKSPVVRAYCAEALGRIRYEPAVPKLIALMRNKKAGLAYETTRALGEIATKEARAALLSRHADVRGALLYFIRMGEHSKLARLCALFEPGGKGPGADGHDAEWAVGCQEPHLVRAALDWGKRNVCRVRPKSRPVIWGEARPDADQPARMGPEDWWKRIEDCGWIAEVPTSEATRIKAALKRKGSSVAEVLSFAGYGGKIIEDDKSYVSVVAAYRKASFGEFAPTDVETSVDRENERATLSFRFGGRAFSRRFEQEGRYVSSEVHALANRAMAAIGSKKRFYRFSSDGESTALICVTPKTYARAKKQNLV